MRSDRPNRRSGHARSSRNPNVNFALAAAAKGLGLPRNATLGLFIIGRTVGWVAHAIEQYESGILIRPRARYLGPRPEEERRPISPPA